MENRYAFYANTFISPSAAMEWKRPETEEEEDGTFIEWQGSKVPLRSLFPRRKIFIQSRGEEEASNGHLRSCCYLFPENISSSPLLLARISLASSKGRRTCLFAESSWIFSRGKDSPKERDPQLSTRIFLTSNDISKCMLLGFSNFISRAIVPLFK